jgi:hypothetical protein
MNSPETRHQTITVVLSQPASDLHAVYMEPVTLSYHDTFGFSNPSRDGVTWVANWTQTPEASFYGTYTIGTFEVSWWEGAQYESVHHVSELIASPAMGYAVKGATRLTISKSRTSKRGQPLVVNGTVKGYDEVAFQSIPQYTHTATVRVTLQQHRPGHAWTKVRTITVPPSEKVLATTVKPKTTTYYRWLFPERRDYKASTSPVMKVRIVR